MSKVMLFRNSSISKKPDLQSEDWGEAFQVPILYKVIQSKFYFGNRYKSTHRGETIPLLIMWKGI